MESSDSLLLANLGKKMAGAGKSGRRLLGFVQLTIKTSARTLKPAPDDRFVSRPAGQKNSLQMTSALSAFNQLTKPDAIRDGFAGQTGKGKT